MTTSPMPPAEDAAQIPPGLARSLADLHVFKALPVPLTFGPLLSERIQHPARTDAGLLEP